MLVVVVKEKIIEKHNGRFVHQIGAQRNGKPECSALFHRIKASLIDPTRGDWTDEQERRNTNLEIWEVLRHYQIGDSHCDGIVLASGICGECHSHTNYHSAF